MTVGNTMESLEREGAKSVMTKTEINFYGPAYNAQKAANMLYKLSDGKQDGINLQSHADDFVSVVLGNNPATHGQRPAGSNKIFEWANIFLDGPTVHNCYLKGKEGCAEKYSNAETYRIKAIINNEKNNTYIYILFLTSLFFSGCCIEIFPPDKDIYKEWVKPDASELEVKKALLECGSPNLSNYGSKASNHEAYVSISLCMIESGFRHKNGLAINLCRLDTYKDFPACNGNIPKRNINRRLNSLYCKHSKGVDVLCSLPAGISSEKARTYCSRKETDPVPLECVP